jgi:hypothetical protein
MDVSYLTPTFARDLQRFRMLRESMEAVGVDEPHYVVVQTEDIDAFRSAGLPQRGVVWMTTADVLPPQLEAERVRVAAYGERWRKLRRSLNKRFGWFANATRDGWHTQQIVKLGLPASLPTPVTVTLDSDMIFTHRPDPVQFIREDGRIALHVEVTQRAHEHAHWAEAARRVLNLPPMGEWQDSFVGHPFVWSREVTRAMHRHLENIYARPWWQALLDQRAALLSEFEVYGHFAKSIHGMDSLYELPRNGRTRWVFTGEHHAAIAGIIDEVFHGDRYDFLVINANRHWPVEPYVPLLRAGMQHARETREERQAA